MQRYDTTPIPKKAHGLVEPDTLLLNTLRDRVRTLGEMILQITDTALSEAEALSREISSSTSRSAYSPLNNRINRNVLNTVVKSSRESGKIVVSVSIVNTREPSLVASDSRRMAEQSLSRPPTARSKHKSINSLRSSVVQSSESKESSCVGVRHANRADDKPWRQKSARPRSARLKMIEHRPNSALKETPISHPAGIDAVVRKGILWDDEAIEQFLKDKPTAGDYQEVIRRPKPSNPKNRSHMDEGALKSTHSLDPRAPNGEGGAGEPFRCRAPVYDKSYEVYEDSAPKRTSNKDSADQGGLTLSSKSSFHGRQEKASHERQAPSGAVGRHRSCRVVIETLSGVYHLPGAILTHQTLTDAEVEATLLKFEHPTEPGALSLSTSSHPQMWSLPIHEDPTAANSPLSHNRSKKDPIVSLDSARALWGSREAPLSTPAASSLGPESSPRVMELRPVLVGEPCPVQRVLGRKPHSSEGSKVCVNLP
ncbi:unnamed protein product [Phytomonas sp. Hart1]|nr:unnamed protein product [Phytomonas sp. Hart1]|eukprot:CCW68519.1 unnamed protein product [Phytomonas sp. isolate Hart1]